MTDRAPIFGEGRDLSGAKGDVFMTTDHGEGTEDHPLYRKTPHDLDGPNGTQMWFIVCDEGWRESIVCERMYEWAADWLVDILQGQPYAPGRRGGGGSGADDNG